MVAALMQFTHIPAGQIAEDLSKGQTIRDNSLEMLIPSEKDGESRNGTVLQNLTTLFGLAVSIAFAAGYFLLTRWLMEHKLDLE